MTNEIMIEALEHGLIMEKTINGSYLSCSRMSCFDCKFDDLTICDFLLSRENFEFLKENYPEYVLKV